MVAHSFGFAHERTFPLKPRRSDTEILRRAIIKFRKLVKRMPRQRAPVVDTTLIGIASGGYAAELYERTFPLAETYRYYPVKLP